MEVVIKKDWRVIKKRNEIVIFEISLWNGPRMNIQRIPKNPPYTSFDYSSLKFHVKVSRVAMCIWKDVKVSGDGGFKRHEKISSSTEIMFIGLYCPMVVGECFSQMTFYVQRAIKKFGKLSVIKAICKVCSSTLTLKIAYTL
jgi:hypothetical protein